MSWVVPGTCYSGLTRSKRIVQEGRSNSNLPGIPVTRANRSLLSRRAGTRDSSESWGLLCSLLLETQRTQCLTPDIHVNKSEPYRPGSSPNFFPLSRAMTPILRAKSRYFFPDRRWLEFVSLHQPEALRPQNLNGTEILHPTTSLPNESLGYSVSFLGVMCGCWRANLKLPPKTGCGIQAPSLYDISF